MHAPPKKTPNMSASSPTAGRQAERAWPYKDNSQAALLLLLPQGPPQAATRLPNIDTPTPCVARRTSHRRRKKIGSRFILINLAPAYSARSIAPISPTEQGLTRHPLLSLPNIASASVPRYADGIGPPRPACSVRQLRKASHHELRRTTFRPGHRSPARTASPPRRVVVVSDPRHSPGTRRHGRPGLSLRRLARRSGCPRHVVARQRRGHDHHFLLGRQMERHVAPVADRRLLRRPRLSHFGHPRGICGQPDARC